MDRRTRDRWVGAGVSLAAHLSILLAMLWVWRAAPRALDLPPVSVTLMTAAPDIAASPTTATAPAPAAPAPPSPRAQNSAPAAAPVSVRVAATPAPPELAVAAGLSARLGDAELAGAADADSGSGAPGGGVGGGCDMARRLQGALRRDPLVQAAVAQAGKGAGGALLVWNGGWVQSDGEDGKGLAAVREAILWEVAFAPPACRAQGVRGLILLSLDDAHTIRLALGAAAWRWSDLLALR